MKLSYNFFKISSQIPMPANRINLAVKMQVDKFRKVRNGVDLTAVRKMMLHEYAVIRKLRHPEIKSLVMIGFASARDGSILDTSFFEEGNDFGYIDFSDWSEEDNNQAKYVLAEYEKHNLVGKNQITEMTAEEFTPTYKKTRS